MAGRDPLTDAADALERGDPAAALAPLLEAWRASRSPRVAALVDDVSARAAPSPDPLARLSDAELQPAWLALDAARRPEDVPALLAHLARGTHREVSDKLRRVAAWPDDPRLAVALARALEAAAHLAAVPRPALLDALRRLVALRDYRVVATLEGLRSAPPASGALAGLDWLERPLAQSAQAIVRAHAAAARLDDADVARCDRVERALAALPSRAAPRDDDALLRAIWERPDDDGPRAVYADWLADRGDVRGEFIQLQLRDAREGADPAGRRRAAEILAVHWYDWVGDVASWVRRFRSGFARGFLAACTLEPAPARAGVAFVESDAWRTVEHLVAPPLPADRYVPWLTALLASPATALALKRFSAPSLAAIVAACEARATPSLRELACTAPLAPRASREVRPARLDEALARGPGAAGLRALDLVASTGRTPGPRPGPADFAWLLGGAAGARLETLTLRAPEPTTGPWLAQLAASRARVPTFVVRAVSDDGPVFSHAMRRDAAGHYTRLEARYGGDDGTAPGARLATLAADLARIDPAALTELVVAWDGARPLAPQERDAVLRAAARFTRLARFELLGAG